MMNCHNLDFSTNLAAKRTESAQKIFSHNQLKQIVAFTLYILGVNRTQISKSLDIPPGTVRSQIKRFLDVGISGFIDKRSKSELPISTPEPPPALKIQIENVNKSLVIKDGILHLSLNKPFQLKVILLSLLENRMLDAKDVAEVLNLSISHVHRLHRDLTNFDIEALIDKRDGQKKEYLMSPYLKGMLIAEYVLELTEVGKASSAAVSRRLEQHCNKKVSERTIRYHLNRIGLSNIKEFLSKEITSIKKKLINSGK